VNTIKRQDIINFIKSQPSDRKVDMNEYKSKTTCGCVMVHYGKEVLDIKDEFICSSASWCIENENNILSPLYHYHLECWGGIFSIVRGGAVKHMEIFKGVWRKCE